MPKKKITLSEAYEVFHQHGLEVEVKAMQVHKDLAFADFIQEEPEPEKPVLQANKKTVKITLYARHNFGKVGVGVGGGSSFYDEHSYGPCVCVVPITIADHLLYQDALARQADDALLDKRLHTYVNVLRGTKSIGVHVSDQPGFDLPDAMAYL